MRKFFPKFGILLLVVFCLGGAGCMSLPRGFLKVDEKLLKDRQYQIRQYETTDQVQILTAVAGVLQDLGFTLDSSETDLGFIAASKKADATNAGQVFLMAFLGGANAVAQCDASQVVKASVITKSRGDGKRTTVRVTFQRVVWNMAGQINRVESVKDVDIYQKFYDSLSKAIFLEAQNI